MPMVKVSNGGTGFDIICVNGMTAVASLYIVSDFKVGDYILWIADKNHGTLPSGIIDSNDFTIPINGGGYTGVFKLLKLTSAMSSATIPFNGSGGGALVHVRI